MSLPTQVDHLVVAAHKLADGVTWCEQTLGITPGPGGEHALFGTHNRLFRISSPQFPRAYFEIIAINPQASQEGRVPGKRWFDLDDAALQTAIGQGPRLIHFVASTAQLSPTLHRLGTQGIDRGTILPASRMTPNGLLQWQITVRPDGQRLFSGCLPTLIEWSDVHPSVSMPDSAVYLQSLQVTHPKAFELQAAYQCLDLPGISVREGAPNLVARLQTPKGLVTLESKGI